ncbi:zinc-binding dehydrogenase [Spirillospora sp. CA-255316]
MWEGAGQVLVEVRAAGVNPVDWKLMAGGLDGLMDVWFPVVPGWDVAGVSAVADFVGGQLDTTLAALAEGGRHVSVADDSVERHGGHWIWVRPDGARLAELAALAERGALTVEVADAFPLEEAGAAFDVSRSGHARGELVITP